MTSLMKRIVDAFFGIEEYNGLKREGIIKRKGAATGFSFSMLFSVEWGLVLLAQILVTFLVKSGWSETNIFLLLWAGNIIIAAVIVMASDRSGSDPTLMEGLRRLTALAFRKSFIGGCLMEVLYFLGLVIWAETSSFYIYFRKRLGTFVTRAAAFVLVAALKMYIWTKVYMFGVDLIDVIRDIVSKLT